MELILQSLLSYRKTTLGYLFINGTFECRTLEDEVREIPGKPVEQWKVKGETAIPSGRYQIILVDSPKFGPGTLSLLKVPGFEAIRIHSGEDKDDTEGCIIVGDEVSDDLTRIHGGKVRGVLAKLKEKIASAIKGGEVVFITIRRSQSSRPLEDPALE